MRCPFCDNYGSRVADSRASLSGIRRRRECDRCKLRFTTYETIHIASPMVAKSDGRREPFDPKKLTRGIVLACAKLDISTDRIERIVQDIEVTLFRMGKSEISSRAVGNEVIERLYRLNQVAYIRYASVYNQFEHIKAFTETVENAGKRFVPREQMELFAGGIIDSTTT